MSDLDKFISEIDAAILRQFGSNPYSGHMLDRIIRTVDQAFSPNNLGGQLSSLSAECPDPCECCHGIGQCAGDCELSLQRDRDDAEERWR